MKKLIIILSVILCSSAFSAPFTNKVVNIMTIYETNSPVLVGFYTEIGVRMATNASPQAFTHSIWNYNPANSVFSLRNTAPSGFARITLKQHGGTDSGTMGSDAGGSNIVIHSFVGANAFIKLTGFMGGGGNEFILNSSVSTNTGDFVVGGTATFNGAITNSGGAVPSVLSANVMTDFPLIAAASFADISYPLTGTITNMVSNLGNPASEDGSLIVDSSIPSNGFVRIRARNVGSLAIDQGNLPYRIHVTQTPDQ